MEILSLTLTNFKVHRDRKFEFQPGTNAICGENGAGKTSLVEAIAWVLFNYQGAYLKKDLIRNGASSAQVRVRFVSNHDGRTYDVGRCTTAGYSIYDPQLDLKLDYSRIDDEILPWLRQQFQLPAGTDLARLFSTTLGIPQGTFTADFLLTPEKRKPIFDSILKVEEYRQVYKDSLSLERYAEAEVEKLKVAIATAEERLQGWDTLIAKQEELQAQILQVEAEMQTAQTGLAQLETELTAAVEQGVALQDLNRRVDALTTTIQALIQQQQQTQAQLQAAEHARTLCQTHAENYHAFLQIESQLQTLEVNRQKQLNFQTQWQQLSSRLSDRQSQLRSYEQELVRLAQVEEDLTTLAADVAQQLEVEQELQTWQAQLQVIQNQRTLLTREQEQLQDWERQAQTLQQQIQDLQTLQTTVDAIPNLESALARVEQQRSRIESATQFRAELQKLQDHIRAESQDYGVQVATATELLQQLQTAVPLWAEPVAKALQALEQGQTIQTQIQAALAEILADLATQTAVKALHRQAEELNVQLQTAKGHQRQYLGLETKNQQQMALNTQIQQVTQRIAQLQAELTQEPTVIAALTATQETLKALNNPQARQQILQTQLQKQPAVAQAHAQLQQLLSQDTAQLANLEAELVPYAHLSTELSALQQQRDQLRASYQIYLQHQDRAQELERYRESHVAIATQLTQLQAECQVLTQSRDQASAVYDEQALQALQQQVQATQAQLIRAQARLPEMQYRLTDLQAQRQQLQQIQTQLQQTQVELKQREKVKRFISFARKAYKEAGPRITERYLVNISREANRLYRELLNRPNVSLEWTRDYEIQVREDAYIRRFINLSGGEQMCAALAVRLALLRVLADLDIAFFDEPTTNMDRLRRQQLAAAIANIRNFRQLFVISHDDTFEQVTENVILIERE